jgi:hypothetical protein
MKFLIIVIICLFGFSMSLRRKSKKSLENSVPSAKLFYTQKHDWDNGKIWFLDSHKLNCPLGSAISNFKLTRPSKTQLSYKYECVTNNAISTDATLIISKSTHYDSSHGDYSTNYLDRHHVQCPKNHVLVDFKLVDGGKDDKQLQYQFKCSPATVSSCVTKTTKKTNAGSKPQTIYLEKQSVGPGFGTVGANQVLAGFQMHSKYKPNKMWYQYTLCTLANNSSNLLSTPIANNSANLLSTPMANNSAKIFYTPRKEWGDGKYLIVHQVLQSQTLN